MIKKCLVIPKGAFCQSKMRIEESTQSECDFESRPDLPHDSKSPCQFPFYQLLRPDLSRDWKSALPTPFRVHKPSNENDSASGTRQVHRNKATDNRSSFAERTDSYLCCKRFSDGYYPDCRYGRYYL